MRRLALIVCCGLLSSWPAWGRAQAPDPWAIPPGSDAPVAAPERPPVQVEAEAPGEATATQPESTPPEPESTPPEPESTATQPESTATQPPAPSTRSPSADRRTQHERASWRGPRVELAYRSYSLRDAQGGRTANTACFSGFLPTRWLRAGGGVEAGTRVYEYGANEGLVSGNVFAGYQHLRDLGRVVPYLVVVGELGVLFGQRFHTPLSRTVRGAGMELGADVNLVKSLYVGLGVGFMLYTIDDLAYDSWGLRLSLGL